MTPTRAEAYRATLAKTAGRETSAEGDLVLTPDEREVLRKAELLDYADDFRRHVAVEIELQRLDALGAAVS